MSTKGWGGLGAQGGGKRLLTQAPGKVLFRFGNDSVLQAVRVQIWGVWYKLEKSAFPLEEKTQDPGV